MRRFISTDITALFGNSVVTSAGSGYGVTVNYEHSFATSDNAYIHADGFSLGIGLVYL